MAAFPTVAVLLRRVEYGDHDLILTLLSSDRGKLAAVAKAAKRSTRRFSGVLELFSVVRAVCRPGRGRGLPILEEAALVEPYARIRSDVLKTAYASYWAELILHWLEDHDRQPGIYHLLAASLGVLDDGRMPAAAASVAFQARLLQVAGLNPDLRGCVRCRSSLDAVVGDRVALDVAAGGLVCSACAPDRVRHRSMTKGAVKQLQWLMRSEPVQAARLRMTDAALGDVQEALEAFVPYHLGRAPKSLAVLRQLRAG